MSRPSTWSRPASPTKRRASPRASTKGEICTRRTTCRRTASTSSASGPTPERRRRAGRRSTLTVDGKDVLKTFEVTDGSTTRRSSHATSSKRARCQRGEHRFAVALANPGKDAAEPSRRSTSRYVSARRPRRHPARSRTAGLLACDAEEVDRREQTPRGPVERFATPGLPPAGDGRRGRSAGASSSRRAEANGERCEAGIQLGDRRRCSSRPSSSSASSSTTGPTERTPHPIDEYELASRLSYFLWSSMPDEELFDLAAKKQLDGQPRRPGPADAQGPEGAGAGRELRRQWLQLQRLKTLRARPASCSRSSTSRCARRCSRRPSCSSSELIREDRSDPRLARRRLHLRQRPLAKHYGIADTNGNRLRKGTPAATDPAATSSSASSCGRQPPRRHPDAGQHPDRHLEPDADLAGEARQVGAGADPRHAAAAAAAGRAGAEERRQGDSTGTLRQRMEQHRKNPACATCHARMDPIGFAFENFDAIGAFRAKDGDFPIDPSGVLPDGRVVQGPERAEGDPEGEEGPVRPLPGREDADLRPGPRAGVLRPLGRGRDRDGTGEGRLPVLGAGDRDRPKRPVPDAAQGQGKRALA